MERFTTEQRTRIIEFYYLNLRSIILTQRAYRRHFNVRISPSEAMIRCLVDRHHQYGTVKDLPRTGRPRLIRTAENIKHVEQTANETSEMSTRRRSTQLKMSRTPLWSILKIMAYTQTQNSIEKIENVEKVTETEKKKDDTYLKNGNHKSVTEQNDKSNVKGTENGNDNTDAKKEDGNNKKDLKENETVEETNKENKLSSTEEEKSTENQNDKNCDEDSLDNKLVICKELYSSGSRNFLLKNYQDAADMLGEACGLFEEIYDLESSELGMPLLLYAKSLIALSLEENKVLDVPDVEEEGDSDDQPEKEDSEEKLANDKKPENKSEKT